MEFVVFRPSSGTWLTKNSVTGARISMAHGTAGDVPVTGQFDITGCLWGMRSTRTVASVATGRATEPFGRAVTRRSDVCRAQPLPELQGHRA